MFLAALLAKCDAFRHRNCLTLTAIHPDGKHRTPSRHVPLNQPDSLHDALQRLLAANRLGWGAFVGIGLRRRGLRRYQRGGVADVVALPAVFVDVDDASPEAFARLRKLHPSPSCITFTGGGYHAYWWLNEPLTDMNTARKILRGLQRASGGDSLSAANAMRLVGSRNTKSGRDNALCRLADFNASRYTVADFSHLLPVPRKKPRCRAFVHFDPARVAAVTEQLLRRSYVQRGEWLSGRCIYPQQHRHDDAHPSFGFNTRSGNAHCFRCGSIRLSELCDALGIVILDREISPK